MRGLSGKVAIITGASRGIGLAIAERLVSEGVRVVITGRKPDALAAAVAGLGGPELALGVAGHTADSEHWVETVARTLDAFGRIDFLVNNTGINPSYGPLIDLSAETARTTVNVNVVAALEWVQCTHQAWLKENGGAIVNMASASGLAPARGIAWYGASKAMLISLTEALALELAPQIRVNAVAPAVVKTDFARALYENRESGLAETYPLLRLGVPSDVANTVTFLLSAEAAWMTGQTVLIDGGATLAGAGV